MCGQGMIIYIEKILIHYFDSGLTATAIPPSVMGIGHIKLIFLLGHISCY